MTHPRLFWLFSFAFTCFFIVEADEKKCLTCRFLVATFQQGLQSTANQHFAGGDTAWEEENLGKYSTSETRFIEILENVCKKSTLSNADAYISVKDLEFKCSHVLEENEESVEEWYGNHQKEDMGKWLCEDRMKVCCPEGHYGKLCQPCPGIKEAAKACFGRGKCDGAGSRSGKGTCKCDNGYLGLMCKQCESGWYAKEKSNVHVTCEECFSGCAGGCKGPSAFDCKQCKIGYKMNEENECVDVDECSSSELNSCTKEHDVCINNIGSYRCVCKDGYTKNENTGECELDISAHPHQPFIRPDILLRVVSMIGLFGCVVLVVWRRSPLLCVMTTVAVLLIILIELYVNPDAVPDQVKSHFDL